MSITIELTQNEIQKAIEDAALKKASAHRKFFVISSNIKLIVLQLEKDHKTPQFILTPKNQGIVS